MNLTIILLYLLALIGFGMWGKLKAKNAEDFRVAGRRLGSLFYTGTMSAVVLGGASTVGGVGLGYKFGISGMWLVVAIAVGVLVLSLVFAPHHYPPEALYRLSDDEFALRRALHPGFLDRHARLHRDAHGNFHRRLRLHLHGALRY